MFPQSGGVKDLVAVEDIKEKVLYWLSLDRRVQALAERLLDRFADTVGDLPASAGHHHSETGGLYRHSLEVALRALEEFEGNVFMERQADGTVDSFRSSRNRPRWQYAKICLHSWYAVAIKPALSRHKPLLPPGRTAKSACCYKLCRN